MSSNEIKVFIKVRPLIPREKNENLNSQWHITERNLQSKDKQYNMTFDNIFDENKSTQQLFDTLAKPIVVSAVKGINGTIFAYGQTSSGKTYTMMGSETCPGIIPLSISEIFDQIEKIEDRLFLVRVGYIEIYNEKIFDLLDGGKSESVKIFEMSNGDVNVKQVERMVTSVEEIIEYYDQGNKLRRTSETGMNERSSRSHAIFKITIESREEGKTDEETAVQVSNLNLVDLAGSERANQTKSEGERLKEGGHINKSLLALGNVIRSLSEGNIPTYINYRDSKLTRILSASLGGNAMTSIICTITPAALEETHSTLLFAQNAKKIKNKPTVNEVMTDQTIMKRMEREIRQLKEALKQSRNCEHLKQQILQREGQFLHSHGATAKSIETNRRRTWAASCLPSQLPLALSQEYHIPQITSIVPSFLVEQTGNSDSAVKGFDNLVDNDFQDEFFAPASEANLDRTLSPGGRDTVTLSNMILTPREMKKEKEIQESPNPQNIKSRDCLLKRIQFLEDEIQELSDFKKVETHVGEDHAKLSMKLNFANEKNALLELKIEELQEKINKIESNLELNETRKELDKAVKAKTEAENNLSSSLCEHEIFKETAKKREEELRKCLAEARKEAQSENTNEVQEALSLEQKLIILQEQSHLQLDEMKAQLEAVKADKIQQIDELQFQLKESLGKNSELEKQLEDSMNKETSSLIELQTKNDELLKKTQHLEEQLILTESNGRNKETLHEQQIKEVADNLKNALEKLLTVEKKLMESSTIEVSHNEEINRLMQKIETLGQEIIDANKSKEDLESQLKSQVDNGTEAIHAYEMEVSELRAQRNELDNKLLMAAETIQKIEDDLKESQSKVGELEIFKSKFDALEEQLIAKNQIIGNLNIYIEGRDQEITQLQNQDAELKDSKDVENLKERLFELEKQNNELKIQAAEIDSMEYIKAEVEELRKRLAETSETKKEAQSENTNKVQEQQLIILQEQSKLQLDEMKAQLEAFKADKTQQIDELQVQLKELHAKNSELEKQLEDSMNKETSSLIELQGKNVELLKKTQHLEEQLILTESNGRNKETLHEQQMKEVEGDLKNALEKLLMVEKLMESHNEEINRLMQRIEALGQEIIDANKSKEDLESQLKSQVDNGTEAIHAYEKEVSELRAQRNELDNKLLMAAETIQKIEEDLKESQSKVGELEIFKSKFDALEEQLIAKNQIIGNLNIYIEGRDQEITQLQNQDAELKDSKDVENLKERLFELEKQNNELKIQAAEIDSMESINAEAEAATTELSYLRREKSTQDHSIEALNVKIKEVELQRDEVIENYKKMQLGHSKLCAEKINLESKIVIFEEEIKDAKRQLKERTDECEDVKARYRRRSCDSDKKQQQLENEKAKLLQSIGAAEASKVLVEKELNKLRSEYLALVEQKLPQLQAEVEKLKIQISEHEFTTTVIEEKYQQTLDLNRKLQAEKAELTAQYEPQLESILKTNERIQIELDSLNAKIEQRESEISTNNKVINDLRVERESLILQIADLKLVKDKSPEKRLSNELYVSQNQQLLLDGYRVTPSRAGERNAERKTRRQSVHDERRRLSIWERFTDVEVQTEDVSEICACSELALKVKELQIEVRKRDCKVANMERMAQHNPLKLDIDELKKSLAREQRDHQQTRSHLESTSRNVHKLQAKIAELSLNQKEPKSMITRACQTADIENYIKKERNNIEEATEKENVSSNIKTISVMEKENLILKKKLQDLEERRTQPQTDDSKVTNAELGTFKENLEKLQKKYDMTRRLCNLRNDDIAGLRLEIAYLKEQISQLQAKLQAKEIDCNRISQKYQTAKDICQLRLEKLNTLRLRLGESDPKDEQD